MRRLLYVLAFVAGALGYIFLHCGCTQSRGSFYTWDRTASGGDKVEILPWDRTCPTGK